jgi:hypothetical protein
MDEIDQLAWPTIEDSSHVDTKVVAARSFQKRDPPIVPPIHHSLELTDGEQ